VRIVKAGPERVDELEPLWKALQEHHAAVMPQVAGLAPRDLEESWQLRRDKYLALLSEPASFVMIAQDDSRLLGYAMVRLSEGSVGYATSATVADIETVSVLADARGEGIGTALMDAVNEQLLAIGVKEVRLGVVAGNDDAIRFYERRGMQPFAVTLIGPVSRP
jgi:ribosomal protein S18 acetylase RimI-like enzyme